jgi:hypothetical protein
MTPSSAPGKACDGGGSSRGGKAALATPASAPGKVRGGWGSTSDGKAALATPASAPIKVRDGWGVDQRRQGPSRDPRVSTGQGA